MTPSIGRIVHFVLPEGTDTKTGHQAGDHLAAIITRIWDPSPTETSIVQLTAFVDGANYHLEGPPLIIGSSVHQDPAGAPGTFHEPERV